MNRFALLILCAFISIQSFSQQGVDKFPVDASISIFSVFEDTIYFLGGYDTLYKFYSDTTEKVLFNNGSGYINPKYIDATEKGVYFYNGTLYYYNYDSICSITIPDIETFYGATTALRDSFFYIMVDSGFHTFNGSHWNHFYPASFPADPTQSRIFIEKNGTAWVYRADEGIYRFDGTDFFHYDSIYSSVLHADIQNRLWIKSNTPKGVSMGTLVDHQFKPIYEFIENMDINAYPSYITENESGDIFYRDYFKPAGILLSGNNATIINNKRSNGFELHGNYLWESYNNTFYRYDIPNLNPLEHGFDKLFNFDNLKTLDINNMLAPYNSRESLHPYTVNSFDTYMPAWPKDSSWYNSYNRGLIIGGLDEEDSLCLSYTLKFNYVHCFNPGPLDTITGQTNDETAIKYDRIFGCERKTIEEFIYMYANGFVHDGTYQIPSPILNWPAHGEGNFTRKLAPFIDLNSDGKYNPLDGDYPDIMGDKMLWYVINDNFSAYRDTLSKPLGLEIHVSAYAYKLDPPYNDSLDVVNNCQFVRYEIYNRSETTYSNTFIGLHDFSVLPGIKSSHPGEYVYAGCHVDLNTYYSYNFRPEDDTVPDPKNLITNWTSFLEGPLADENDGLDNDHDLSIDEPDEQIVMSSYIPGDCCFPSGTCQHLKPEHIYNLVQGKRQEGNPYYYFDNYYNYPFPNYDTSSGVTTKYIWPDNSNPEGWGQDGVSMPPWKDTDNNNEGNDKIHYAGMGPFTFEPGEKITMEFVIGGSFNESTMLEGSQFEQDVRTIRNLYFNRQLDSLATHVPIDTLVNHDISVQLFPNPVSGDQIRVNMKNLENDNISYEIFDIQGKQVLSGKLEYAYRNVISVKNLKQGTYFFHFYNSEISVCERLLIIK